MSLLTFILRLLCWHRRSEFEFVRNIYGDEINACGGKRSVWRCPKCGNRQDRDDLHDDGDLRGKYGPLPEHGWD